MDKLRKKAEADTKLTNTNMNAAFPGGSGGYSPSMGFGAPPSTAPGSMGGAGFGGYPPSSSGQLYASTSSLATPSFAAFPSSNFGDGMGFQTTPSNTLSTMPNTPMSGFGVNPPASAPSSTSGGMGLGATSPMASSTVSAMNTSATTPSSAYNGWMAGSSIGGGNDGFVNGSSVNNLEQSGATLSLNSSFSSTQTPSAPSSPAPTQQSFRTAQLAEKIASPGSSVEMGNSLNSNFDLSGSNNLNTPQVTPTNSFGMTSSRVGSSVNTMMDGGTPGAYGASSANSELFVQSTSSSPVVSPAVTNSANTKKIRSPPPSEQQNNEDYDIVEDPDDNLEAGDDSDDEELNLKVSSATKTAKFVEAQPYVHSPEDDIPPSFAPGSTNDDDYWEHEKALGNGMINSYQVMASAPGAFEKIHEPATPDTVPTKTILSQYSSFDKKGAKRDNDKERKGVTFGEPTVQVFSDDRSSFGDAPVPGSDTIMNGFDNNSSNTAQSNLYAAFQMTNTTVPNAPVTTSFPANQPINSTFMQPGIQPTNSPYSQFTANSTMNYLKTDTLSSSMNNMKLSNNVHVASSSSPLTPFGQESSSIVSNVIAPFDVTSNVMSSESTQNAAFASGNAGMKFDTNVNNDYSGAENADDEDDYEDDAEDDDEGND